MDEIQSSGNDGPAQVVTVSMPPPLFEAVDAYRRSLHDLPSRPAAIRKLIAKGLANSVKETV